MDTNNNVVIDHDNHASVVDPALDAAIGHASRPALVAVILKAADRLSGETFENIETITADVEKTVEVNALRPLLAIAHQIDPDSHVVTEDQAIWTMHWDGLNADGSRKYPDMPETEEVFEDARALALLLINEVVHINSHHWKDAWPTQAREAVHLGVDCSDVFAWACVDSESASYADIEEVYRYWARDPRWGTAIWSMIRRRQMPQRPVEKRIREAGIWDLDDLIAQHGLRANRYDGISGIEASRKYEAYCVWERGNGHDPLPFDAGWWKGWERYVAANHDWQDQAWKDEGERLRLTWLIGNGYEQSPASPPVPPADIDIRAEIDKLANMVESAAVKRAKAAEAEADSARAWLLHSAAATERAVTEAMPRLIAALQQGVAA